MVPIARRGIESVALKAAAHRVRRAAADPDRSAERTLRAIIERAAECEFGRRHDFAGIDSIESFRSRVPVATREEARFDLERAIAGVPDVLTRGRAIARRVSRGRRGDALEVPVTAGRGGAAARDGVGAFFEAITRRHPGSVEHGVLAPRVGWTLPSSDGQPRGTRWSHVGTVLPRHVRRHLVLDEVVHAIPDLDVRRRLVMRLAIMAPLGLLLGGDPAELALLFAAVDGATEAFIRDVRQGTFDTVPELERSHREAIAARVRPDVARSRELERCRANRGGRLLPCDYWRLAAVGCLCAGRRTDARTILDPWLDPVGRGGPTVLDLGLLTAEAPVTIGTADGLSAAGAPTDAAGAASAVGAASPPHAGRPDQGAVPEDDPGVPLLDHVFLEFVEIEAMAADPEGAGRWPMHTVGGLQPGVDYAVFATTFDGLYRHELCEVVRPVAAQGRGVGVRLAYVGAHEGMLAAVP